MKKTLAILLALVMTLSALCIVSCDKSGSDTKITYSEYHQNALNFNAYKPLLEKLLNKIQKAYDGSDKKALKSFKLDDDFKSVSDELQVKLDEMIEADGTTAEAAQKYLKSAAARTKVNQMVAVLLADIANHDILMQGEENKVDEAWFTKLDKDLKAIRSELANGNG